LSPEVEAKLKHFCEEGGLIVGNADRASEAFTKSFSRLGSRIFPYEFRPLPDDHVIFSDEMFPSQKWTHKPSVLGLSNGVRELMLLFPTTDPARAWQIQRHPVRSESHQLMTDVVLYAGGQNLSVKGKTYLVTRDANQSDRQIQVARLDTGYLWDPEPAGWRRLAAVMHNRDRVELQVMPVKLGGGKLSAFKIAHLTGVGHFKLPEPAREELQTFVQDGGTLIVNSAGGNTEFAQSTEAILHTLFPDPDLTTLPQGHAIYTAGAVPFKDLGFRRFARGRLGDTHAPQIKGITIDSRTAVFYSAYDLSAGIVGMPVDGIVGYEPDSATALMEQMILYAAHYSPSNQVSPPASGVLDSVAIGDPHSETDHAFTGESTQTGIFNNRRWRDGAAFQYTLNTRGEKAADLVVTYWGGDGGRVFDVLANNTLLATQQLNNEKPGVFFDRRYPIPTEVIAAAKDGRVTIKFIAKVFVAGGRLRHRIRFSRRTACSRRA
jgi:hypothetical protein